MIGNDGKVEVLVPETSSIEENSYYLNNTWADKFSICD
jgi:hypothetical protein